MGVLVPSWFWRTIETCSLSRRIWNPNISKALITLDFEASTGNFPSAGFNHGFGYEGFEDRRVNIQNF